MFKPEHSGFDACRVEILYGWASDYVNIGPMHFNGIVPAPAGAQQGLQEDLDNC